MKAKFHKFGLGLAASMALLAAALLQAADKYGPYVVNATEELVRDPFGNCVRTPFWTPDQEIPECGGVVAKVEAPPLQPVIETITLGADAYFAFDKATLKPEGQSKLDQLAQDLRRVESVRSIQIVGHTDSIGTEAYNLRLSERRAITVKDYLVSRGVNPSIITAYGVGEADPIAPNTLPDGQDNPAGRAQNRRVEITVEASQRVTRSAPSGCAVTDC
jgi:OOP family OmpA-OmpF porin